MGARLASYLWEPAHGPPVSFGLQCRRVNATGSHPMADDIVTLRLKQLAQISDEEFDPTGDTLELEELELIGTAELKQLMEFDSGQVASDSEREDWD